MGAACYEDRSSWLIVGDPNAMNACRSSGAIRIARKTRTWRSSPRLQSLYTVAGADSERGSNFAHRQESFGRIG
jgi:hypothetical protein